MSEAEYAEAYVSRTAFAEKLFVCPSCGGNKLRMTGRYERSVVMEFAGGEMQSRSLSQGQPVLRFTVATCDRCQIRFYIEADHIVELRRQNRELQNELDHLRPKPAPVKQPVM